MTNNAPRVVYDCMVFLQGAGSRRGPARRCLELVDAGKVTLCMSRDVIAEIQEVLSRVKLQRKFPLLSSNHTQALLRTTRRLSLLIPHPPKVFNLPRDQDDEIYTDLAIASGAQYLVTWNFRHLTYLMTQDTTEGKMFCSQFPKLQIVDPPEFLKQISPE